MNKRINYIFNQDALKNNLLQIRKVIHPKCQIIAVLKGNAYGHGLLNSALKLQELGIRYYAVATLEEAITLRKAKIFGEILILGKTEKERLYLVQKYQLMQTIIDYEYGIIVNKYEIKVHIKIDTGMHRLGIRDEVELQKTLELLGNKVEAVYTHLSKSTEMISEHCIFTKKQINHFLALTKNLENKKIKRHVLSSNGVFNYPEYDMDFVRVGVALFGYLNNNLPTIVKANLQPVLTLQSQVIQIKKVYQGESIGYGDNYIAKKEMFVAIVSIGYSDGIFRSLSKKGHVIIKVKKRKIIGSICMDFIFVKVDNKVNTGDIVTIIGEEEKEKITIYDHARWVETNTVEIMCKLNARVQLK